MNAPPVNRSKRTILMVIWMLALLIILVFFYPGCASKGDISGTVSYQGDTLTSGSVLLVASDLKPRTTLIEKDGTYKFTGVPTGEARLAVYNSQRDMRLSAALERALAKGTIQISGGGNLKGFRIGNGSNIITVGNSGAEDEERQQPAKLPETANDPLKSGLHYDIKNGPNTYDLAVK